MVRSRCSVENALDVDLLQPQAAWRVQVRGQGLCRKDKVPGHGRSDPPSKWVHSQGTGQVVSLSMLDLLLKKVFVERGRPHPRGVGRPTHSRP